jgi:hypothetical protein
MSEWKSIESAPRDGTKIVLAEYYDGGRHPEDARWMFYTDYWREYREGFGGGFGTPGNPSHWMPLPDPPTT